MADTLTINYGKDTGSGKKLNTGSLRRSYNTKKKKKSIKFKVRKNLYLEGR
jgi:hypothetical protein